MPTRIPVQIAEHQFPSINQARIHYSEILKKYSEGQEVTSQDRTEIIDLVVSSGATFPIKEDQICAMRGHFGKKCFARVDSNKVPHSLSIMFSLKKCVATEAPSERLR